MSLLAASNANSLNCKFPRHKAFAHLLVIIKSPLCLCKYANTNAKATT